MYACLARLRADCRPLRAKLKAQAAGRDDDAGVHADALVEDVSLTDHATGAEHGEAAHDGVVADPGARANDRTPHYSAGLYLGAVKEYAPLDHGPPPHHAALSERGTPAYGGEVRDPAFLIYRDRRQEPDVLAALDRGVDVKVLETITRADGAGEDIVGGCQVAARRPYIPPVRACDVGPEPATLLELGEDLTLYRDFAVGRDHSENLGLEHVDAGVDQVRRHLVGGRLLDKAVHQHLVVDLDETVGRGILYARQNNGGQGVRGFVRLYRSGEVHTREHIAVDDHQRSAVEVLFGVLDAPGGPEGVIFDGVIHRETNEILLVGEVGLDRVWQVA